MQPEVDKYLKMLPARLEECAKKVGGKRALAQLTQISEAQLFRYIKNTSDLPVSKLMTIALAADVHPAWLLTGQEELSSVGVPRPAFREELLVNITQTLEELLIEYEKNFTPAQRAQAIAFMYKALRYEEVLHNTEITITKPLMLGFVNFLVDIKNEDILVALNQAIDLFEYSGKNIDYQTYAGEFSAFVNYIMRAYEHYYNSASGRAYFDRLGTQILPVAAKRIDKVIATVQKNAPANSTLTCLDVGCGNGRELSYIHRHYSNINVQGLDQSSRAVQICQELARKDMLPDKAVIQSNMSTFPYGAEVFDFIFSRQALYSLPYLPGSGLGAEAMLAEIHRVLKPNGYAYIMSRFGIGREYLLFSENYDQVKFETLAVSQGFDIVWFEQYDLGLNNLSTASVGNNCCDKYTQAFHALIKRT